MANENITKEDLNRFEENFARIIEKYAKVKILNMEPPPQGRMDKKQGKHSKVETKR